METLSNIGQSVSQGISNAGNAVSNKLSAASSGVTSAVQGFSTSSIAQTGSQFMQSNSIIAKFAFLIMVVILFAIVLNLGMTFLAFVFGPKSNPYLVSGMLGGTDTVVIVQNPADPDAVTLLRSNNQSTGIEFTWSIWLAIADPGTTTSVAFQNVFNKGNGAYNTYSDIMNTRYSNNIDASANSFTNLGIATVNNAPGLYIITSNKDNNANPVSLLVVMDTVDTVVPTQTIEIDKVPLNKWFHVAIRMENTLLDVYINGTVVGRTSLAAVPKQNYNDVNVCANGGFAGNLSNLQYYNRALSASDINSIVRSGPNTTASNLATTAANGSPYYIADSWFYGKLSGNAM